MPSCGGFRWITAPRPTSRLSAPTTAAGHPALHLEMGMTASPGLSVTRPHPPREVHGLPVSPPVMSSQALSSEHAPRFLLFPETVRSHLLSCHIIY